MKDSIVWGTCWFSENVDTLVNFYINSLESLKLMNIEVFPVIFDAKYVHYEDDINYLKSKIDNITIIKNEVNIYPNKNYGVALITNLAYKLNAKYVAIVDSDWNIKKNYNFINNLFVPLLNSKADLIIPNIGNAAGRSNILIGQTIVSLFYPEYSQVLKTPFPGSLIGLTQKIYSIISSDLYHFDWGGEWDVISLVISKKMKVCSVTVDVNGTRHRPNSSKIFDSFQIWRAVFCNPDFIRRIEYMKMYNKKIVPYNLFSRKVLEKNYDVNELIELVKQYGRTETVQQLLYMILYPIAFLNDDVHKINFVESKNSKPYDSNEIKIISDLAIYCTKMVLSNCDIDKIIKNAKEISGNYFGNWSTEIQEKAIMQMEKEII